MLERLRWRLSIDEADHSSGTRRRPISLTHRIGGLNHGQLCRSRRAIKQPHGGHRTATLVLYQNEGPYQPWPRVNEDGTLAGGFGL